MIEFEKRNSKVILLYSSDRPDPAWVYHRLETSDTVTIAKAFTFTKNELISSFDENYEYDPVEFEVAFKVQEYYLFPKEILSLNHDLYIHEDIRLERKLFVAERGIAIFPRLDCLVDRSIYVGGDNDESIPETVFKQLLKQFPNTYELNRYAAARIDSVISSYIETKADYDQLYQKYLNKKVSAKGKNLQYYFSAIEIEKYNVLLWKLTAMLDSESSYTEAQWQEEILQIILLLYPKYIHVFKEAPVRDTYSNVNRKIDLLLVDATGNTDIVEIKKPFDRCIVTSRTYRDNHIPLRELSGAVMQIEKYIFYLNKWGRKGEEILTDTYKDELSEGFEIKITNPSGIIIMGRTDGLSSSQLQDFEVIKRKYKNVIDIMTYDDLVQRIKFTIEKWQNTHNKALHADGNSAALHCRR